MTKTESASFRTTKANKRLIRKAAKLCKMSAAAYMENCVMSAVAFLFPDAP